MHMLSVISKRIKSSSRDAIIEEIYMKEQYETKHNESVFKAQNLIGTSIKVKTSCLNNIEG